MTKVSIVKTAAVTALGNSVDELWQRVMSGETGIRPVDRFAVDHYETQYAACVPGLDPDNLTASLLDRLFANFGTVPAATSLILATTKSGIDDLERRVRNGEGTLDGVLPSPMFDAVARRFDLSGSHININAACASSTIAVGRGAAMIASGAADCVLVACYDLVSEFVFSGFSALKAVSSKPSKPFDATRDGLTLGEGAAAVLLMSGERAEAEGLKELGSVIGWGVANDANHITAPARDGCGLIQATTAALAKADVSPDRIAGINAHGTGTVFNDLMELKAFHAVFGDRPLPIHSLKGALGHTLGAAGGTEVAIGVKSLSEQAVPPTIGFTEPEEGAEDRVSGEAQAIDGDYLLTTNSGFGGINAALVLKKGGVA